MSVCVSPFSHSKLTCSWQVMRHTMLTTIHKIGNNLHSIINGHMSKGQRNNSSFLRDCHISYSRHGCLIQLADNHGGNDDGFPWHLSQVSLWGSVPIRTRYFQVFPIWSSQGRTEDGSVLEPPVEGIGTNAVPPSRWLRWAGVANSSHAYRSCY